MKRPRTASRRHQLRKSRRPKRPPAPRAPKAVAMWTLVRATRRRWPGDAEMLDWHLGHMHDLLRGAGRRVGLMDPHPPSLRRGAPATPEARETYWWVAELWLDALEDHGVVDRERAATYRHAIQLELERAASELSPPPLSFTSLSMSPLRDAEIRALYPGRNDAG